MGIHASWYDYLYCNVRLSAQVQMSAQKCLNAMHF